MISRFLTRSRDLFIQLSFLLLVVCVVFLYMNHLQETYKTAQRSEERYLSELASVKYQLSVVTEYKNRIDKMLTDAQNAHESDKERFKDIMESCVALKQQAAICQGGSMTTRSRSDDEMLRKLKETQSLWSQFEDLQTECKKVREDYDKLISKPEKLNVAK